MNQDRYEYLQSVGCVCCAVNHGFGFLPSLLPVEIHHLNAGGLHGGKRLGDEFTIPLCKWHHRGVATGFLSRAQMTPMYGPSWANGSKPFRAVYGSDADLLARANAGLTEGEAK